MALTVAEIRSAIEKALPGAKVEVSDTAGDGVHYVVYVESDLFEGKSRIEQHRMVYDSLGSKVGTEVHALMVQTAVKN